MADFDACRFDFRLDAKNGLTPSKRKKSERRGQCYNTLFKCKFCGSLFDNRPALMEHKLIHNKNRLKCPICGIKVTRKVALTEHMQMVHSIGKLETEPLLRKYQASLGGNESGFHTGVMKCSPPLKPSPLMNKKIRDIDAALMQQAKDAIDLAKMSTPASDIESGISNFDARVVNSNFDPRVSMSHLQQQQKVDDNEALNLSSSFGGAGDGGGDKSSYTSESPMSNLAGSEMSDPPEYKYPKSPTPHANTPDHAQRTSSVMPGCVYINVPIFISNNSTIPSDTAGNMAPAPAATSSSSSSSNEPALKTVSTVAPAANHNPQATPLVPIAPKLASKPTMTSSSSSDSHQVDDLEPGEIRRPPPQVEVTDSRPISSLGSYPTLPLSLANNSGFCEGTRPLQELDQLVPKHIPPMNSVKAKIKSKVEKNQAILEETAKLTEKKNCWQLFEAAKAGTGLPQPSGGDQFQICDTRAMMMNLEGASNQIQGHFGGPSVNYSCATVREQTSGTMKLPLFLPEPPGGRSEMESPKRSKLSCDSCDFQATSTSHLSQHKSRVHRKKLDSMLDKLWQNKMKANVPSPVPFSIETDDSICTLGRHDGASQQTRITSSPSPMFRRLSTGSQGSDTVKGRRSVTPSRTNIPSPAVEVSSYREICEERNPRTDCSTKEEYLFYPNAGCSGVVHIQENASPTVITMPLKVPAPYKLSQATVEHDDLAGMPNLVMDLSKQMCQVAAESTGGRDLMAQPEVECVQDNGEVLDLSIPKIPSRIPNSSAISKAKTRPPPKSQGAGDFFTGKFQTCRICKQLFDSAEKMWEHSLQHNDFQPIPCDFCDYSGQGKDDLRRHCLTEHGMEVNEVGGQGSSSTSETSGKIYNCERCSKTFFSYRGYHLHMLRHSGEDGETFVCGYEGCSSKFLSGQQLKDHIQKDHLKKSRYSCPKQDCAKDFVSLSHLKNHLLTHAGIGRTVYCDFPGCHRSFKVLKQLKMHQLSHAGKKPLKCPKCGYACRQRNSMNWHMKSKHGLEKFQTTDRRTVYISRDGTQVLSSNNENEDSSTPPPELVSIKQERASMSPCQNQTVSANIKEELVDSEGYSDFLPSETTDLGQMDGNHDVDMSELDKLSETDAAEVKQESPSLPPDCFTSYLNLKYYPMSERASSDCDRESELLPYETKYHTCKICKQLFDSAEKMWSHRLAEHEEVSDFYCELCGFTCDTKAKQEQHNLECHGDIGDVKEFVCNWCGKEYSSRSGFKQHLLRHKRDGAPLYPCPYNDCAIKLPTKQGLKEHVDRIHSENQPQFPCPFDGCKRKFHNTSMLRSHQVLHSGERPLLCDHPGCSKSFRETKHLKVHKMLHTDERPLKCHVCDYSCRQRNSLNWHMKSKHSLQKQVTPEGKTTYTPLQDRKSQAEGLYRAAPNVSPELEQGAHARDVASNPVKVTSVLFNNVPKFVSQSALSLYTSVGQCEELNK